MEPEIPNNTGSVGRTCVGTGCRLHLVGPLGFDISDKAVKRAGLDYWQNLDLKVWDSCREFMGHRSSPQRTFYFTKKATTSFWDVSYQKGDWLIFGKETVGLDPNLLREVEDQTVRIPMCGPIRSLNLSNAVSIVIYEAMRQLRTIV